MIAMTAILGPEVITPGGKHIPDPGPEEPTQMLLGNLGQVAFCPPFALNVDGGLSFIEDPELYTAHMASALVGPQSDAWIKRTLSDKIEKALSLRCGSGYIVCSPGVFRVPPNVLTGEPAHIRVTVRCLRVSVPREMALVPVGESPQERARRLEEMDSEDMTTEELAEDLGNTFEEFARALWGDR